jgi:hypothetical protein
MGVAEMDAIEIAQRDDAAAGRRRQIGPGPVDAHV